MEMMQGILDLEAALQDNIDLQEVVNARHTREVNEHMAFQTTWQNKMKTTQEQVGSQGLDMVMSNPEDPFSIEDQVNIQNMTNSIQKKDQEDAMQGFFDRQNAKNHESYEAAQSKLDEHVALQEQSNAGDEAIIEQDTASIIQYNAVVRTNLQNQIGIQNAMNDDIVDVALAIKNMAKKLDNSGLF